ncbi:MAG: RIP metalloprotease RseP, partial [Burkholderiaceae bacterium]
MLTTIIAFLVALTILIFVHEMGHYLAARYFDVKVLRFSIGFGKPLFQFRLGPDQTEWSFGAIPLGGYVKMVDERDTETPIASADLPRAFTRQSLGRRSIIVAGGPLANFLLAIVLYAIVGWIGVDEPAPVVGQPPQNSAAAQAGVASGDRIVELDGDLIRSWHDVRMKMLEPTIERRAVSVGIERNGQRVDLALDTAGLPPGAAETPDFVQRLGMDITPSEVLIRDVQPDSPAAKSGLVAGDELIAIAGEPIRRAGDLIKVIRANPGQPVRIDVRRGSADLSLSAIPESVTSDRPEEAGKSVGRIGAALTNVMAMELVQYGPLASVRYGAKQTWDMTLFSLRLFGKMIVGDLSLSNISGPVTIATHAGKTAEVGWYAYLKFLAIISISLGVLNLLPIP